MESTLILPRVTKAAENLESGRRGEGSNPSPSSGESANRRSLARSGLFQSTLCASFILSFLDEVVCVVSAAGQAPKAAFEAGLSPSSMDNWKAGIRDRLLREPSRNGDPGVQTTRKPGECRIRAPLDLRRRNPLSLKQPSAKRTVDQRGTVSSCAAALDPQRALEEWLPS